MQTTQRGTGEIKYNCFIFLVIMELRLLKYDDMVFIASDTEVSPETIELYEIEIIAIREGDIVDQFKLNLIFMSMYPRRTYPNPSTTAYFFWDEDLVRNFKTWTKKDIDARFDLGMIKKYREDLDVSLIGRENHIKLAQSCL